jgi:Relaxase/Mobilisation nuclease domain
VITKSVPSRAHTRTFGVGIDYITEHTHQRAVAAASHSFDRGVAYASSPEKAAWVHLRGVMSVETAAIEMEAVAALSSRCRDPVYHLIVAYAKHERPTRDQVISDAERLLKAIGMEKSQYVLAAHQDTDDFHAHVIANRIGPDGKANDLWHERIIRERVCAEIAAERGWDIVVGHHNRDIVQSIEHLHELPAAPQRRLSEGAYRRLHERGELPWEESARSYVLDAVDKARNWSELHERLGAHGVVAKLIRRGERVQGLAFAEGHDRRAPGCAASRVDRRCAFSALERRFGPFTPDRTSIAEIARPGPWSDTVRPTILTAVDAAKSWKDLADRLGRDGIVIKLVQRGTRVLGLAFAQGRNPGAPGCGASRIDPRCKKTVLEQRFGPFPEMEHQRGRTSEPSVHGDPRWPDRGHLRARAEQDARHDPATPMREARSIADHARMRTDYAAYRDRFYAQRHRLIGARRNAAWESERAQREREAQKRREARQLLRAVARLGTRGLLAHQLAYWSIDALVGRRRTQERTTAHVRWEATKIVLASERKLAREEKPMNYRSFVTQRARTGDLAACRVLDSFEPPTRAQHRERQASHRATFNEVRARLEVIRLHEEARYERARAERRGLERVERPLPINDALAAERRRIREQIAETTRFTDAERVRLTQLAKEKRSWNPLTRAVASRAEAGLHAVHESRYDKALAQALRDFEGRDVPLIAKRIGVDQQRYREYVAASLSLEREMNRADDVRDRIPRVEHQLTVLERAGVSQIEIHDATPNAGLRQLAGAVDQQYRFVPDRLQSEIELGLRREQQRAHERSRESMSMGNL